MEGWVGLGYPSVHRPGVKLAISWSRVWRPNHYTTEPPSYTNSMVHYRLLKWRYQHCMYFLKLHIYLVFEDVRVWLCFRVKISHIEHVFVTHGSWDNVGGLTGKSVFYVDYYAIKLIENSWCQSLLLEIPVKNLGLRKLFLLFVA